MRVSRRTCVCLSLLCLWLNLDRQCLALEPVSTAFAVATGLGISFMYAGWNMLKCKHAECCSPPWVKDNVKGLENTLRARLHGQPLVHRAIVRAVKDHLQNPAPKKALVLSFHGWTGGGKNYASSMLAEALYEKGMNSKYVSLYVSTKHFPHQDEVPKYRKSLQKEIEAKVKECGRTLFIFDEIDKMPNGLIDIIKPYLDFHEKLDDVDYRKSIFIFLSNTAGDVIARATLDAWKDGIDRSKVRLNDMERVIELGSFNEKGGLYRADIVEKNLIDVFVPFLPLERKQVVACVRDEFKRRNRTTNDRTLEEIADELDYIPSDYNLYSSTGCKKIHQKVAQHLGFQEKI
uniref:Torsin-1A C-terminal domain-containing protein n=1 Tax=Ixodes ricinus TaxID=34613 RepID=A0A0K8RDV7_IXORI